MRVVLGIVIAALVPAFATTHAIVSRYKEQRQQLAAEWTARGREDLVRRPLAAVTDFETALSYNGEDTDARFQLAQALVGGSRDAEARAQLLTLWAEQPGDGPINLELGRLAARANDVADAVRYYHGAIDGAWESNAATARRQARIELATLLLNNGEKSRAQAELIAMIDDLPPDAPLLTDVGGLLVRAGADNRARPVLERALSVDARDARAARLLGAIAFRGGDYRSAADVLADAAQLAPLDADEQQMLEISRKIPVMDPTANRLSTRDRAARALAALAIARERFGRCTGAVDELARRIDAAARLDERALRRDPDLIDEVTDLVFDVEALPASSCGQPSVDDRALQLVAAERRPRAR